MSDHTPARGRHFRTAALVLVAVSLTVPTGFYAAWFLPDDPKPAAGAAPSVGGVPLFATWPKDKAPDAVVVLTGQTWGYLRPCGCSSDQKGGLERRANLIAALKAKFPGIQGPKNDDICYATQNRQDAVRELVGEGCDAVLVVGSPNSSNSNRLRELAEREGAAAWLIDGAGEIDPAWVAGRRRIGVTAGASAPDVLVQGVLARLRELGAASVRELHGEPEDMVFALPKELRLRLVG